VTGGGVSGSNMPSQPWATQPDVTPVEDTSLDLLLAGRGLPPGADAELRPVADVLAALSARPSGGELTGLAAARAEFRRHVARPVQVRQSPGRRPGGLASRLGVKVGAATALVVMGLGGAAAAAYAGVLPGSWQQFAHRTFGAPAYRADHHTSSAGTGAPRPAVSRARQPAHQTYPSGPPARHGSVHHAATPHQVGPPAARPFARRGAPPGPHFPHNSLIRPERDRDDRRPLRVGQ
jgi:hypothetical protein